MQIAVIGTACRFPGANNYQAFWRNIAAGKGDISVVPKERWDWSLYWGDPQKEPNKSSSKWGGFIDRVDAFDHQFFGVLPKVARTMDPQQRIMLELTWACLEDAGLRPSQLRGQKIGVIVGVFNHDYKELQEDGESVIEAHHSTGTAASIIANRVSHYFDFRGPSVPIDTACSSSLNAIHSAIHAIQYGDCEMAIAGGINLLLTPTRHISFSKMGMLSSSGTCRTFDAGADGYVRGEGAGLLLLKPLEKALADGDSIHGVIKGSAVNHCGETYTLTYPSARAQADVIVSAHERAGIPVNSVGYVEAHGTGTPKGDPIEFEGLLSAFRTLADQQQVPLDAAFCGLSSVKTNIGHLEAAAGVAGVIKVLQAFRHQQLPGLRNFSKLNPKISIDDSPFYILDGTREWAHADVASPRRAGVSSFGFGGTNAHIILEEPPQVVAPAKPARDDRGPWLFALSAKSAEVLLQRQHDLLAWLREDAAHTDLVDISATLLTRRDHFAHRFACVAADAQQLVEILEHAVATEPKPAAEREPISAAQAAEGESLLAQFNAQPESIDAAGQPEILDRLGSLYTLGIELPWTRLFGDQATALVALPTYPFARDSFWVPARIEKAAKAQLDARKIHPVLHARLSAADALRYTSTFDGHESFLADHVIGGRPILPAVVYLEMVRAAVVAASSGENAAATSARVRFSNVAWLRPLEYQQEAITARVELVAETANPHAAARFSFRVVDESEATVYCRGEVSIEAADAPSSLELIIDSADIELADCTAASCYAEFAKLDMCYGPAQQALHGLRMSKNRCIAELSLPAQLLADREAFVIHPSLADAALQAAVAFMAGFDQATAADARRTALVPFALERLEVHGACTPRMRVRVSNVQGGSAAGKVDIDVVDADQPTRPCLAFRGLSLRALGGDLNAPTATSQPSATAVALSPAMQGSLYHPVWQAEPLSNDGQGDGIDHLLLVGDRLDVDRLTQQLRASARFANTRIESLCFADQAELAGPGSLRVRAGNAEDFEAAVAALVARGTKLEHVLSIAPASAIDDFAERVGKGASSLFALVKAMLRPSKRAKFLHLIVDRAQRPDMQGLSGFYRTLKIEKPSYSGRVVHYGSTDTGALADVVWQELQAADKEVDIRYQDGLRLVRRFASGSASPTSSGKPTDVAGLRTGGVYLITGGMGALGLIFARHLCEHYQATVYLTGRSAPTEAYRQKLDELSALGGQALFAVCDVAVRDDVHRVIEQIRAAGQPLRGILHSAGVIEDNFILRKSADSFARVVAPKTLGSWHLDAETADQPLDFFALFSSVTGVLGNIGQCDYGFGNAFEDYFAHQREELRQSGERNGKTLSFNWPYWKEGGMRLTDKEEEFLRRNFGIVPLLTQEGIEVFEYALTQSPAQVVVMPGDAERVHEVLGVTKANGIAAASPAATTPVHAGADAATGDWQPAISRYLSELFGAQLNIPPTFEANRYLREYGFDSVVMIELINELQKVFGSLPMTLFFEQPTLAELSRYLIEQHPEACRRIAAPEASPAAQPTPVAAAAEPASANPTALARATSAASVRSATIERDDIAIIGLSGRYPQSESIEQFWENLKQGRDCVAEIPPERWALENSFQAGAATPGKSYSRWGGFLSGVDQFDPLFFNISPKETEIMDPNEWLFLETAALAIEDAGYAPNKLVAAEGVRENPVGVFVGVMWGDYQLHSVKSPQNAWTTSHSSYWAIANRVSHYFNFSGPSMAVDTACSSSLTAIHLACAAIRNGEVGVAIAGGVNLSLHPYKYHLLSNMHFLSSDGRCRSFGEGGDGYVPGEGVGAVVLKSLAQARADGDHIYGVIRGSSVNHGGKTSGFTVPNSKRQAALVQDALQVAGVNPRHISYLEAHGTGTKLGDPIEVSGLNKAFADSGASQFCAIGSVKSNLGHLEAAAGMAGLTKVLLQMKHRTLVPSIQSDVLNPFIEFQNGAFYVQHTLQEWRRPLLETTDADGSVRRLELPRVAGISSFGAGGSNAHVIVEEYVEPLHATDYRGNDDHDRPVLFVLSARREAALKAMAENLAAFVTADPELSLEDAAYTLQVGRVPLEHRIAIVAERRTGLVTALRAYLDGRSHPGLFTGHRDHAKRAASAPPVDAWIAQRELPRLAEAWVNGHAVEWAQLHQSDARRRLPLPGYAYQRQRYWAPQAAATVGASLHPLIDANVSTLTEQAFRKTFHADEFFLRDHQLGSNRILPGVAYLEMALVAGRLATTGTIAADDRAMSVCALRDVRWLKPIMVNDGPAEFDIGLTPDDDGIGYAIYSAVGDTRQIHSQGRLDFDIADPAADTTAVDLLAIVARCRMQPRAEIDAAFANMGFRFGPSFQVFERLHSNADEALAELSVSPQADAEQITRPFVLPPSLLDGALRTALGIDGLGQATAGLQVPVQLHRIEVRRPVPANCFVHARRHALAGQSADRSAYDIDLLDASGQLLVRIEQLVTQAAPHLGLSHAPATSAAPSWSASERPAIAKSVAAVATIASSPIAAGPMPSGAPLPPRAVLTDYLAQLVLEVTKIPPQQFNLGAPLSDYGLDSLMILALNEKLQVSFGEVPKTLFYEHQDLASLADYFLDSHAEQVGQLAASAAPAIVSEAALASVPAAIVAPLASTESLALQPALTDYLAQLVLEVTKIPPQQFNPSAPLSDYGLDSLMILALNEKLQVSFGEVPKTLFYEYQDLASLAEYFLDNHAEQVRGIAVAAAAQHSSPASTPAMPTTPAASANDNDAAAQIRARLFECLRDTCGDEARHCTETTPLAEWPIDPIANLRIVHALRQAFDNVEANGAYRHATLADWARAIRDSSPAHASHAIVEMDHAAVASDSIAAPSVPRSASGNPIAQRIGATRFARPASSAANQVQDIAVIGLSGRYPGARNVEEFWQNLSAGRDSISEIPLSRWDYRKHFNADRSVKGDVYSKWGGFIDDIDQFDAGFFNISPREAELLDPQERLFLQTAWECIEDACYTRQSLREREVGVFVGVMWNHYQFIDTTDEQHQSGWSMALHSAVANRVSYFLNLHGPSLALDTMCSSSLTALHLACQSIRQGDCQMAIAGGVNLMVHPMKYHQLAQSQFLSSDGRCRAFGDGGDGYVPGEGVGAVLLKPLQQAIEDGDQIYGVIKATALNHGGKTSGFTVPNQLAQTQVIGKALRHAGWHPASLDYIEAHGTGTQLGDPIEIAALSKAFATAAKETEPSREEAARLQPCRIGSVKSNVGHLESAAGIAGLTKILMQLRHRHIAPSLHSAQLNANIDFAKTPFRVVQALEAWDAPAHASPRRAGLSAFGAGGSNAHVLIEAAAATVRAATTASQPVLFVLSADSKERLARYVERVSEFLHNRTEDHSIDLRSLAYSSLVGREPMHERLAVVASSLDELAEALSQYREGVIAGQLYRGTVKHHHERLDAVLDETQRDALVRDLVEHRRLAQLARAWVSMLDIEWDRYADLLFMDSTQAAGPSRRAKSVRRVSFPTMPFLTRRHWVEQKPEAIDGVAPKALHPLLDENASTLTHQRYSKRFTGTEAYLRDHIVDTGEPRVVLPGAAYLEMARAAGKLAMGDEWEVCGIRNLIWIQPVEVKQAPVDVTVNLSQSDDAVAFEIVRDASEDGAVEGELLYRHRDEVVADEWIDLAALRARSLREEAHDALYDGFKRMGFHYGPSYQVTQTRYRLADGALSRLQLPESLRQQASAYGLHPSLLDGALRTCLAIGTDADDNVTPLVPFALGELDIRHPLTEECYAYATTAAASASFDAADETVASAGLRRCDIVIADADGRVLAKLKDFSARRFAKAAPMTSRSLQYYGYDWQEQPRMPVTTLAPATQTLLLITDEPTLADALSSRYPTGNAVVAQPSQAFAQLGEHRYSFDPGSANSQNQLFAHLREHGQLPSRIVHHLSGNDFNAATEQGDTQVLRGGLQSLRHLFNALEQAMPGHAVRCAYVYPAARDEIQPQHDAISGYARSLLTINHRFELCTIRTEQMDATALAGALLDELETADGSLSGLEIAHWNQRRYQRRLLTLESSSEAATLPLKSRGVYLITGGAGKLGLVMARYLATRYQARLILSGRSAELHEDVLAQIDALRGIGAEVHYRQADLADPTQAEPLLAFAKQTWGGLDGILHCAGVSSDTPITQLDDAAFDALLGPKIDGLVALDRITALEPLDLFVNFSSISAMLGDLGSGAYAAANRFMDSHAEWRSALCAQGKRSGKSLSIGWPLWATGNMEISGEDAVLFGFSGMSALTEAEGVQAFEQALRSDATQVLVAIGDAARIARTLRVHTVDAQQAVPASDTNAAPPAIASKASVNVSPAALPIESAGTELQVRTKLYLKQRLATVLKASASEIGSNATFEQLGMDSVMLMELRASLTQNFAGLPKTVLFEYDTPARLAQFLVQRYADAARSCVGMDKPATIVEAAPAAPLAPVAVPSRLSSPSISTPAVLPASLKQRALKQAMSGSAAVSDDAVAIIGFAGEFPEAADLNEFWNNLQQAKDCLSPIPLERWAVDAGSLHDPRRRYADKGGFMRDVDRFDPELFRMSLSEASKADPQLRVLLRSAWHALEDAAYTPDTLSSTRVGVYVGAMNEDFTWIMSELHARTGEYPGPGSVASELANRISFLMNFRGPSLTVSTACSSSLTAVHLARKAILGGECDAALAGGVNLSLHPSKYMMLRDMKVLSPDGQERTFDDGANGLVPSEGVGMVMLKRLSRAIADGDQIHAVIRGSSISHAGTGAGQHLPNLRILEETMANSLRESGLRADELSYIESHGAGTELGDPIELKAMSNALRQFTAAEQFCAIGTKANLGHMEAASGVCSLIKVLLSMRHGRLSPCANLGAVNTSFEQAGSPFHFPREAQPWPTNARGSRIAGINSFGMSGSNAFVVLESLTPATAPAATIDATGEPHIVVLSAKNEQRLHAYATALLGFIERGPLPSLADLAYSSQIGRNAFEHRLAIVASDQRQLATKLASYLRTHATNERGVFAGNSAASHGLLDLLLSGAAGQDFIDALLQSRQWDKIATLWTRGCAIDWSRLHHGMPRRRVSFPAYPFETLSCDLLEALRLDERRNGPDSTTALPAGNGADANAQPSELAFSAAWFDYQADGNELSSSESASEQIDDRCGEEQARQYWLDYLHDIADTTFLLAPTMLGEYSDADAEPAKVEVLAVHSMVDALDPELIRSLQHCTQMHQIEVETLIAAAWAVLINRYTKARCTQFGIFKTFAQAPLVSEAGRQLVPARICPVGREKVAGWLTGLQRNLDRKLAYAHVPIHQIESWTGDEHLFDSIIAFEKATDIAHKLSASEVFSSQEWVKLELTVSIQADAVQLCLSYRSTQAQDEKIRSLLGHFQVLLGGLATNPQKNPAALTMRTKHEGRETFWKTLDKVSQREDAK